MEEAEITISLTHAAFELIDEIRESGLYGTTREDTVRRIVERHLQQNRFPF